MILPINHVWFIWLCSLKSGQEQADLSPIWNTFDIDRSISSQRNIPPNIWTTNIWMIASKVAQKICLIFWCWHSTTLDIQKFSDGPVYCCVDCWHFLGPHKRTPVCPFTFSGHTLLWQPFWQTCGWCFEIHSIVCSHSSVRRGQRGCLVDLGGYLQTPSTTYNGTVMRI